MKKVTLFLIAIFAMAIGASAQTAWNVLDSATVISHSSVGSHVRAGSSIPSGMTDSLVAVHYDIAIVGADTLYSVDSTYQNVSYTGLTYRTSIITGMIENTSGVIKSVSEIADTSDGGYVVLGQRFYSQPKPFTTSWNIGVPSGNGAFVSDTTAVTAEITLDGDGEAGSWIKISQISGPPGLVTDSVHVAGPFSGLAIDVSNLVPSSNYSVEVIASDYVNGIIGIPISGVLTFTTDPLGAPIVSLNPVYVTNDTILMEYMVTPNGNATNWNIIYDGNIVDQGVATQVVHDTLPMLGLAFGTTHLFEINAWSNGGSDYDSESVTTLPLDGVSVELIGGDSTGIWSGNLYIRTSSEGGSAAVTVINQVTGQNYGSYPASAGVDTVVVPYTGINPSIGSSLQISIVRQADNASAMTVENFVPYQINPIQGTHSTVATTAVNHTVHIEAERTVYLGAINLSIEVEQTSGLNPGTLPGLDTSFASGVIDGDFVVHFQAFSASHDITITITDTLGVITEYSASYSVTSLSEPNTPTIPVVYPLNIQSNGDFTIQVILNPLSSNGGTAQFRGSDDPADLDLPSSTLQTINVPSFNTYTFNGNIANLLQAGADTLYYRILLNNFEGGNTLNGDYSGPIPEWNEPEPLTGPWFPSEQLLNHTDVSATILHEVVLGDSTNITLDVEVVTAGEPNQFVSPQPVPIDGEYISSISGLEPLTYYSCRARLKQGNAVVVFGAWINFTTDAATVDPSGIEEILNQNSKALGIVRDMSGNMVANGKKFTLQSLVDGSWGQGPMAVVWVSEVGTTKVVTH